MNNTRESILSAALRLFARCGFEAASVSQIAEAVGLSKGALYKHYASKRDLLNSILERMARRDAEQAAAFDLPTGAACDMPEAYRAASLTQIADFARAQFRYWTEDAFAADFRRMLTLEQFGSAEMNALYQQYIGAGPLGYVRDLLEALNVENAADMAALFYAPMLLGYVLYDGASDKAAVAAQVGSALDRAAALIAAAQRENQRESEREVMI